MIESRENMQMSRRLVIPGENGRETLVATATGTVLPGKSFSVSITLSDVAAAQENQAFVAETLDSFIADIRKLAGSNGLPV